MGSSAKLVDDFKKLMMNQFEMTDLGILHYFLGLEIYQSNEGIIITQRKYARDLLQKFGLKNCNHSATPANVDEKFKQTDGTGDGDGHRYRRMVDGLLYLSHTCLDIVYDVSLVSRFMCNLTVQHQGAIKCLLCYVAAT